MKGFYGANVVAEAMASASAAAAQGALIKALVPPSEPISTEKSTQDERVITGESAPIPTEIPTPQKGFTPAMASQTESISPATPLIISTNDPFIALSQAMKDGSSLVVTPSSIPRSATWGLDADLSSDKGSKEVFEDSKNEPIMKT